MKLRPRQEEMVSKALAALKTKNNTLCIAPTGAGKSIMLSALAERFITTHQEPDEFGVITNRKVLIIQHRQEIFDQNVQKLSLISPSLRTSLFNADDKDMSGQIVFTMIQTLSRKERLNDLPYFDMVIVDEAHHMGAESYINLIAALRQKHPHIKIVGFTATPSRGDKKGIGHFFDNVGDMISIHELIDAGHLVPPRTFVVDTGTHGTLMDIYRNKEISDMTRESLEADLVEHQVDMEKIIQKWQEYAEGRKTVAFCPSIASSKKLVHLLNEQGITAFHLDHEFSSSDRESVLTAFRERKDVKIISNAMILTEGWDCPEVSCVMILRTASFKSTFLQMVGRGLRSSPGKRDCLILDFGVSSELHKTLEQQIADIFIDRSVEGEEPTKTCPECATEIPIRVMECPLCGYIFNARNKEDSLKDFSMKEISLLEKSSYSWVNLGTEVETFLVNGFDCFCLVCENRLKEGEWIALGLFSYDKKTETRKPGIFLMRGERLLCLSAANDFMNIYNMNRYSLKNADWMTKPVSAVQREWLEKKKWHILSTLDPKNAYEAGCVLQFLFAQKEIQALLPAGEM